MIGVIDVKWRTGVAMDYQFLIRVAGSIYDIYVDDYRIITFHTYVTRSDSKRM